MNAIVTDKKEVKKSGAEWVDIGGVLYYLYILPVGTVFQTYAITGYSPIIYFDVDIPTGKTLSFTVLRCSPLSRQWDASQSQVSTDGVLRFDANTGKYFVRFNNDAPLPQGYNFTVVNFPFMAVLQAK